MCGPGMTDILYGTTQHFQAPVQHLSLHKAGPAIVLPMKYNKWSGDIVCISDRGFPLKNSFYLGLPGVTSEIIRHQAPGIALPEESSQVIDPPLGRSEEHTSELQSPD